MVVDVFVTGGGSTNGSYISYGSGSYSSYSNVDAFQSLSIHWSPDEKPILQQKLELFERAYPQATPDIQSSVLNGVVRYYRLPSNVPFDIDECRDLLNRDSPPLPPPRNTVANPWTTKTVTIEVETPQPTTMQLLVSAVKQRLCGWLPSKVFGWSLYGREDPIGNSWVVLL